MLQVAVALVAKCPGRQSEQAGDSRLSVWRGTSLGGGGKVGSGDA